MKSVPQEIIDQAKICPFDYACINDSEHNQCKKKFTDSGSLLAIIPKRGIDIENNPYCVSLPYGKVSYCMNLIYADINKEAPCC